MSRSRIGTLNDRRLFRFFDYRMPRYPTDEYGHVLFGNHSNDSYGLIQAKNESWVSGFPSADFRSNSAVPDFQYMEVNRTDKKVRVFLNRKEGYKYQAETNPVELVDDISTVTSKVEDFGVFGAFLEKPIVSYMPQRFSSVSSPTSGSTARIHGVFPRFGGHSSGYYDKTSYATYSDFENGMKNIANVLPRAATSLDYVPTGGIQYLNAAGLKYNIMWSSSGSEDDPTYLVKGFIVHSIEHVQSQGVYTRTVRLKVIPRVSKRDGKYNIAQMEPYIVYGVPVLNIYKPSYQGTYFPSSTSNTSDRYITFPDPIDDYKEETLIKSSSGGVSYKPFNSVTYQGTGISPTIDVTCTFI